MPKNNITLGRVIKAARKAAEGRITQQILAEKLGVKASYIGKLEADYIIWAKMSLLEKISEILPVSLQDLLEAREKGKQAAKRELFAQRGFKKEDVPEGTLGFYLVGARLREGLSQSDVIRLIEASEVQVNAPVPDQRTLSAWETNREIPAENQLNRLIVIYSSLKPRQITQIRKAHGKAESANVLKKVRPASISRRSRFKTPKPS